MYFFHERVSLAYIRYYTLYCMSPPSLHPHLLPPALDILPEKLPMDESIDLSNTALGLKINQLQIGLHFSNPKVYIHIINNCLY
jgi:hypothetical protein